MVAWSCDTLSSCQLNNQNISATMLPCQIWSFVPVIRILKIKLKLNSYNCFIIVIFQIHVQSFFFYVHFDILQKWLGIICKMAIPREFDAIYGCLLLGRNIIHIDYTFSQAPQQQSHFIRHLLIPGATSYLPSSLLLPIAMS